MKVFAIIVVACLAVYAICIRESVEEVHEDVRKHNERIKKKQNKK